MCIVCVLESTLHYLMYHGSVIPSEPDIIPSNPSTVIDKFITVIRIHLFIPVFKFQRFWGLSRFCTVFCCYFFKHLIINNFCFIWFIGNHTDNCILYYLRTALKADCEFFLNTDSHVKNTVMFW